MKKGAFSPYCKPCAPELPLEPSRTVRGREVISRVDGASYDTLDVPVGCTHIYVDHESDGYGDTRVVVEFFSRVEVHNPLYEEQLARYAIDVSSCCSQRRAKSLESSKEAVGCPRGYEEGSS